MIHRLSQFLVGFLIIFLAAVAAWDITLRQSQEHVVQTRAPEQHVSQPIATTTPVVTDTARTGDQQDRVLHEEGTSALAPSKTQTKPNAPGKLQDIPVRSIATATPHAETPGPLFVNPAPASTTASGATGDSEPPVSSSALTPRGILQLVNEERRAAGLGPLQWNATLGVIAEVKTADMITKQYFAHEAPDGTDIGDLATRYHYEYLRVGENLAMGDFTSDADVMQGWMNSPGHRANILNPAYTEIGIAALEGMHDGRLMWYAVQEFGRPASLCPRPDSVLAQKITLYETQLVELERTLSGLRADIEATTDPDLYNAKAKDYNTIVDLYNQLIVTAKAAASTYNESVRVYNVCIES